MARNGSGEKDAGTERGFGDKDESLSVSIRLS